MRVWITLLLGLALALPVAAQAAFPGSNPDESVRLNPPNDPDFDRCESDNQEGQSCTNVFDEEYPRFGFAPSSTQLTAQYDPAAAPPRQVLQNTLAGRSPLGQVSGVSADRAWKRSIGVPSVDIAILDTGIRWDNRSLRLKIALNEDELPLPEGCEEHDCDGDGAFTAEDYAGEVDPAAGTSDEETADTFLDASDLIATFSDGSDADGNGFVDDIAGWDFFDDDNDPYDASSHASASNHGTGRAREAAQQTNDNDGGTGLCPRCEIVPLRVWDTFVVPTEQFAFATAYASDNEVEVVEVALGGLTNPRFAREAMREAYRQGVFFTVVSSDLNTANHNFPTTYDESMMVSGTVSDVEGLGQSNAEVGAFFNALDVPTNAPVTTWFRNSGTTQYGGHGHIMFAGTTGSQATGQASGGAGLIASYGREQGYTLAPNEIKQLFTMTAEDVRQENTGVIGIPDPAQPGWDQHFGYGRADLGHALEQIAEDQIPPQALITSPDWFAPFPLERQTEVTIAGRIAAPRSSGYTYELQWAPGIEPAEDEFVTVKDGGGSIAFDGELGTVDLEAVRDALDARPGGGAADDPTAPQKGPGDVDPNEPAFTVRVQVRDAGGVLGEDRKVLFAYRDDTLMDGWLKRLGTGGEASQRLWDLDGDNALDVVLADSSGSLRVFRHDGTPLTSFNGGQALHSEVLPGAHLDAPFFETVDPPRAPFRTPAIGDVDGDDMADIVAAAGEKVYAWDRFGDPLEGFPVRLDPAFSRPQDRTRQNYVKRGFFANPALADLVGDDTLEIVQSALDQHVYAWDGEGQPLSGFPVKLKTEGLPGAEIIATPAIGDIAGDSRPELVLPTQEFDDAPGSPDPTDIPGILREGFSTILANAIGGSGRTYAVNAQGQVLTNWPITLNGAVPDALPFVAPGVAHAMGNLDGDPQLEVVANLASGDVKTFDGDGSAIQTMNATPATGEHVDKTRILNLFEHPIVADLDGLPGAEIFKGGLTLMGLVDLGVAVGQNFPYNHVVQGWNAQTGESLPTFPQAVEDYQLLSSPSVADAADTPGKELLVGTGLYLLRSFNLAGLEGAGFPKFTGGWLYAVPATGDIDGDGKLDIATMTREGNAFVWRGDQDACAANAEWWTSGHDERSTSAHGTDTRPPNAPADTEFDGTTLRWSAPGDDWACGDPARLRVLTSESEIRGPQDGTVLADEDAGASELSVDAPNRYLAVVYADEAGNWGLPAVVDTDPAGPGPTPTPTETATPTPTPTPTSTGGPTPTPTASPGQETLPKPRLTARRYGRHSGRIFVRVEPGAGTPADAEYVAEFRKRLQQDWRPLGTSRNLDGLRLDGVLGRTYEFRVQARTGDGRTSPYGRRSVTIPLDQDSRRLELRGFRRSVRRKGAYGRTVAVARRTGAVARLRFAGRRISVIGTRGVRITVDGRRVDARNVRLARGRHVVRIRATRRGARFDAIALWR